MKPTQIGFVYIIEGQDGCFKIGSTRSIESRLTALQTGNPFRLKIACLIENVDRPHLMEVVLHQKYARRRVEGEWFRLTTEEVEDLKAFASELREIKRIKNLGHLA